MKGRGQQRHSVVTQQTFKFQLLRRIQNQYLLACWWSFVHVNWIEIQQYEENSDNNKNVFQLRQHSKNIDKYT